MSATPEPLRLRVPPTLPWWLRGWFLVVVAALAAAGLREALAPLSGTPTPVAAGPRLHLAACAAALALHLAVIRRWTGRIELRADRVVLDRRDLRLVLTRRELEWGDLRGYRDAGTHVELVDRAPGTPLRVDGELAPEALHIPTPTASLRAAVLALLDARGVPRLDA